MAGTFLKKTRRISGQTLLPILLLLCFFPFLSPAHAEFFKYTDANGTTHFVDDISLIPPEYRQDLDEYVGVDDHLTPEQKREKRRREELAIKDREKAKEMERVRQRTRQESQKTAASETRISFVGNGVYLYATLAFNGKETRALLKLDTGAYNTFLHYSVAERLGIMDAPRTTGHVAGGGTIEVSNIQLDYIKVGPKSARGIDAVFAHNKGYEPGYEGLLGMNFLKRFPHIIDVKRHVIRWQ